MAVLDFLTEEGFRPRLDEDGDVYFKYQGMTYIVITWEVLASELR